jgi:hypothetical protein
MADPTGYLTESLGSLVARAAGGSPWSRGHVAGRRVDLAVFAGIDADAIERDADGQAVSMPTGSLQADFSAEHWDTEALGLMYGDRGVLDAVNGFLASRGYAGRVSWSEQGRQGEGFADFDMDDALVDEIWPGLRSRPPSPRGPAAAGA